MGKVLTCLQNKAAHVPYRDSKLTHYLKDSVGGRNAKTLMIVQVSPLEKDQQESLSTLAFGQKAQFIQTGGIKADVRGGRRPHSSASWDQRQTARPSGKPARSFSQISLCSKKRAGGYFDRRCGSCTSNWSRLVPIKQSKGKPRPRSNDSGSAWKQMNTLASSMVKRTQSKSKKVLKNYELHVMKPRTGKSTTCSKKRPKEGSKQKRQQLDLSIKGSRTDLRAS